MQWNGTIRWRRLLLLAACTCNACGSESQESVEPHAAAASTTAETSAACRQAAPFYFEIGDRDGTLVSGSVGNDAPQADTPLQIASASKWLFGAYVAEVRGGVLTQEDLDATRMLSGYVDMNPAVCSHDMTVADCFAAGTNSLHTEAQDGRFYYGAGHFQHWAVANELGGLDPASLAETFRAQLGPQTPAGFSSPALAAGAIMSAAGYGGFLRRILRKELNIANLLGTHSVCAMPGPECPTATFSPENQPWSYSIGHWVEDDPDAGSGSFSSPGAFGFYPWIDATRTYYGVVARESTDPGAYTQSSECGAQIRVAFATGTAQP